MTKSIGCSCAVALLLSVSTIWAQSDLEPTRLGPEEVGWSATPGVEVVDIAGDDEAPGMYAYRVRFPEGFRNEPHFHPDDRIVTVISGTLHMAYGDRFEEDALKALSSGSVWTEPGNQPHFVWAMSGEVVIQVVGYGPSATIQVGSEP